MADLTPTQQATLDRWEATITGHHGSPPDHTFVGNPADGHSFYQFRAGHAYKHTCPDGLIFNAELSVCDYPGNVSRDNNPAPRS